MSLVAAFRTNVEEYNEYMKNYFQTKQSKEYRANYYKSKQVELREYRRRRYWVKKIGEAEVDRIGLENLGVKNHKNTPDKPMPKRKRKKGMIINSLVA